jgi:hypothetical protein
MDQVSIPQAQGVKAEGGKFRKEEAAIQRLGLLVE